MSFKIIDTYNLDDYHDVNVWKCTTCGWEANIYSEGDCPCDCPKCISNEYSVMEVDEYDND